MRDRMRMGSLAAFLIFMAWVAFAEQPVTRSLTYAPAPANNPLKGLVPYAGDRGDLFPHSMEFSYVPLSSLVVGERRYDWDRLEDLLDRISARGHQAVFRIYLEYPGKDLAVPTYLADRGVMIHRWDDRRENRTPDYAHPALRACLRAFIGELGRRYDGDPRIGFITAGLLGKWGEWHTYPREDLWAGKDVQDEVMSAYESAFKVTPILLRYPADQNDASQAPNATRGFGYHDDSFAWATLDTGKKRDDWFFMTLMHAAGDEALTKWQRYPIGGEIRPEAWGEVFDKQPSNARVQDFAACVQQTHVTWLMDSGLFHERTWTAERRANAEEQVRRMGYAFHVPEAGWDRDGAALRVWTKVQNRGVAPFYYAWSPRFALLSQARAVQASREGQGDLRGLLPGASPGTWRATLDLVDVPPGAYAVLLQVPNPLPAGLPVRFANATQDQDLPGWLTLGIFTKP